MFKFFGSKLRLAPGYPTPELPRIVEPFAGSAAYAVLHRSAPEVILLDRDEAVVSLWHRLLRTSVDELLSSPTPAAGDRCDDLLVAFAAGRTTRDTPGSFIVSPRMAQRHGPMVRRIANVLDEVRHFDVRLGDYTAAPDVEATWFIDPPYQPTGTGRWDRTRGGRYLHSNRDIDFAHLADWTHARAGQVIACDQRGADWLPWTDSVTARDGTHREYGEVWFHRTTSPEGGGE